MAFTLRWKHGARRAMALDCRGEGVSDLNLSAAVADLFPAEARLDSALQAGRLGYWELDGTRRLTSSAHAQRQFRPAGLRSA